MPSNRSQAFWIARISRSQKYPNMRLHTKELPKVELGPQRYTPPPGLGLEKIGEWLVWTIWW